MGLHSLLKSALFLFVVLFGALLNKAQAAPDEHNGSIEGLVYQADTRTVLPGAIVKLAGTSSVAYTNELGYFSFRDLTKGEYQITVSFIGFRTETVSGISVMDGASTPIKVFLEVEEIDLPAVEVQSDPERNLNTISTLDIQTRPVTNAQEILRIVPGLFIAQHAGGGKAEQLFLRGFDIDHGTDVNISADGIPVNMVSHAHGQGYADLHFVIPELVQRVDFRKGPYYAELGNFTTAGAVQLETMNTLDNNFLKLEGGSFDSYRLVAGLNLLSRESEHLVQRAYAATELNYTNGYFDAPQNFNRVNLMAKYNLVTDDKQSLTAAFSTFTSSWDASGQIPERAVKSGLISRFGAIDPTEGGQTSRTNVSLQFFKNLSSQAFTKHQFYFTNYQFELYSNFTFFARDPDNGDEIRQKEKRALFGYKGQYNFTTQLGSLPFESEAGLQLRADRTNNTELSYTKGRFETIETVMLGNIAETNAALYYNGTLWLTPELSLNAGLRFDQFIFSYNNLLLENYSPQTVYKNIISPKLNLHYQLSERWQLYAQSGLGYHSNDTRVVVAQNGLEILPKAYGVEAGVVCKPLQRAILQLSLWRLDLDQEFVYVGDEGVVEPGGKTRRMGVDASLRYQIARWLYFDTDIDYSYARGLVTNGEDERIPLAPVITSTGGLRIEGRKGLGGSLRYRFMGDRPANEDNSLTADGYFLLDATVHYHMKHFELGLSAQNLLNTEWKEAQFETTSRLQNEPQEVTEIHFTPGTPLGVRAYCTWSF